MAKPPPSKNSPISTKAPSKGPAKGRAKGRARGPAKAANGRPAGLFTWLAIGLVVVVVATLVIIKVASGSGTPSALSGFQATDATTAAELTAIPLSIFNTIGVNSPVVQVAPPQAIKGPALLTAASATGTKLPWVLPRCRILPVLRGATVDDNHRAQPIRYLDRSWQHGEFDVVG